MTFEDYISEAWNVHALESQKVADEFVERMSLIESSDHIAAFGALVAHVTGEHLGIWSDGISFLRLLKNHSLLVSGSETEKSLVRSIASLQLAGGLNVDLDSFSISDRVRIFAVATCHLCSRDVLRSQEFLSRALVLARGLESTDPANRSLAVSGNNLACTLEEKLDRSPAEVALMIMAAETARQYWELAAVAASASVEAGSVAGGGSGSDTGSVGGVAGWREIAMAEYRLAMTYLQASDFALAMKHAQLNFQMCCARKASDGDMFFAYEALALVQRALGQNTSVSLDKMKYYLALLSGAERSYCEEAFRKVAC